MKRIISIILLVSILIGSSNAINCNAAKDDGVAQTNWPKGPKNISAASAIVMELNTGVILYEKNMNEKQYPASITKIMTTLLCLENSSMSDTVTFSRDAIFGIEPGSSHIGIDVGEKISMEDCLYGIMLMSANEACLGVAEHVAGNIPAFVDMMNQKAKDLGCLNTHFVNPNGLFDKKHYTTAYDMALISQAAMKNSMFRKITATKRYDIPATNKTEIRYLYNHSQMVYPRTYPKYGYDYCIGGKTGYTDLARWTLVTYAVKDGMELVCVVMRTEGPPPSEPNAYTDTIDLFDYAFENFSKYDIAGNTVTYEEGGNPLFTTYNPLFDKNNSQLQLERNTGIVLPNKATYQDATQCIEYYSDVALQPGDNVIGKVSYTYEDKNVGTSNIIYNTTETKRLVANDPVSEIIDKIERKDVEKSEKVNLFSHWKIVMLSVFLLIVLICIAVIVVLQLKLRKKARKANFYALSQRKRRKHKRWR